MTPALVATLLTLSAASIPSGVAVVTVGRSGLSQAEGAALVERISAKLSVGGLPLTLNAEAVNKKLASAGISDSASCDGQLSCARDLGAILGVSVVIAVDIGALRKSLTIHLEAVSVRDGRRIAQRDFSVERKTVLGDLPMLADFLSETRGAIAAVPSKPGKEVPPVHPPPVGDSPVRDPPIANPELSPPAPPMVVSRESPGIPVAAWATGGVAVGAGVGALVFTVMGASGQARLSRGTTPDGRPMVGVPEEQARQLAAASNRDYTIGAVAAAGCAVLTGVTAWLIATR